MDSVSQTLAQYNPKASRDIVVSNRKTTLNVGEYYKIVWNNHIEECRIEKLIQAEDGSSDVYFSISGEKMLSERKIIASASTAFKTILLKGGETSMDI